MIHDQVSGNKWFKLKHNLIAAIKNKATAVVSFGGASSNHIHALAAACQALDMPVIGIIRGVWRRQLPLESLTPTLQDALAWGMRLIFIDKEAYRQRGNIEWIHQQLPLWWHASVGAGERHAEIDWSRILLVPEGGSNSAGVKGVSEWAARLYELFSEPATFVMAVGSGGTLAGFASSASKHRLTGIPVVKAGADIRQAISNLLIKPATPWEVQHGYEWGGYGKAPIALLNFRKHIEDNCGLPLDPVYTAKALYGLMDLASRKHFITRHVVFVHTGGLQGNRGF